MDKKGKEQAIKLIDVFDSWKSAIKEVKNYLEQDIDYFTVSTGPWTITYDGTKESEVRK